MDLREKTSEPAAPPARSAIEPDETPMQVSAGGQSDRASDLTADYLLPFFALGLLLALFNCLAVAAVDAAGGVAVVVGVVYAQVGLVASWGVFSSAHFARRLGISAVIGLASYGCFTVGILVNIPVEDEGLLFVIAFLPLCALVLLAVQMPMWAARTWLQCEIAQAERPPCGSYLRPTRISDLIVGTTTVCVILAFAKLAPRILPEQSQADEILTTFVSAFGISAVASLATVTPLVFITLGARHSAAVLFGIAGWFVAVVAVLLAFAFAMNTFSSAAFIACLLFTGSFAAVMCAGLLLTRGGGYRLLRRGRG